MGVDVSGALAEVGGHASLDLRGIDEVALVVHLLHDPGGAGDGDLLAWWGRLHHGAQLGGVAAYRVLLVLLEHGVELERVGDALARQAHDEAARLRLLDLIRLEEVVQKDAEVVPRDAVEDREVEHALGKPCRRELALAGKRGDGLVVEQTVG